MGAREREVRERRRERRRKREEEKKKRSNKIGEEVEGRAGEGGWGVRGVTCPSFQYKLSCKY